jgi:hypothetical protein
MSRQDSSSAPVKTTTLIGFSLVFATYIIGTILLIKTLLERCPALASNRGQPQQPSDQPEDDESSPSSTSPSGTLKKLLQQGKEAVAIWGGLAGLLVAVMWILGRAYARGYFEDAMGIPLYHLKFSTWEYGEPAWLILLVEGVVILLSGISLSFVVDFVYSRIRMPEMIRQSQLIQRLKKPLAVSIVFVVPLILTILFQESARKVGADMGYRVVTEKGIELDLVSNTPLQLGSSKTLSNTIVSETDSLFSYQDYRLLTFNEGRYFVFQQVDYATCRPKHIYIIDEDQLVQVKMEPASALSPGCTSLPSTTTLSLVSPISTTIPFTPMKQSP